MKKILVSILLVIIVCCAPVKAQQRKLQNLPYIDNKIFRLGFSVGFHVQDLLLTQSGYTNENGEVWFSEIPSYSPGFNVGLVTDIYLLSFLNLRLLPTLSLGGSEMVLVEKHSKNEFKTTLRNNFISLPVMLKYTADRVNNYRPYITAGIYGSLTIAPPKNQPVLLKPLDMGAEVGIGCDFYFPYFKLSPELKFSFGMIDLLEKNRPDLMEKEMMKYTKSLDKALRRSIVLSFNFE